jgi:hypothetical protein
MTPPRPAGDLGRQQVNCRPRCSARMLEAKLIIVQRARSWLGSIYLPSRVAKRLLSRSTLKNSAIVMGDPQEVK